MFFRMFLSIKTYTLVPKNGVYRSFVEWVEHLMPRTPTEEWLEELDTDEETYMSSLHRLGNLTLAAKPDNSKMSNQLWEFKNDILKGTGYLKMNMDLLSIPKWTLNHIEQRTVALIQKICETFLYPDVDTTSAASIDMVDEKAGLKAVVSCMFPDAREIRKNNTYEDTAGNRK